MDETTGISRRGFLAGAGLLAVTAAAGMTGCGSSSSSGSDTSGDSVSSKDVEATLETDVVVIGMGAAGMLASIGAADKGADVIAIDAASGFAATTNCSTTGAFFVEGTKELENSWYVTKEEAYDYLMEGTHYTENSLLVRNMLEVSGRAADILDSTGMPFLYMFQTADPNNTDFMNKGGYCYTISGADRAPYFEDLMGKRKNITSMWNCKASSVVQDSDGTVTGIICDNDGVTTQINSKAVISCGGGFISNDDMKKKYYGGSMFVNQGFPTVDGSGINLCLDAGAQIGKNFTVSVNEMGGCNYNASPSFAWIPGTGVNQCLYLLVLGGLLVNKTGKRFVRESRLVTSMMFTGEPLVREGTYYVVLDETFMAKVRSTPLLDLFPDAAKAKLAPILQMGFTGFTCDQLDTDLEKAIDQGWAYKADTVQELADKFDLENLEDSVTQYNAIPTSGDPWLFLEPEYVKTVENGPFYIFQYNPGSWCSMGGIRTDDKCRAVDPDGNPIKGLYTAGLDADLFSVPYYSGGTTQGFSYASGLLAGETAAGDIA